MCPQALTVNINPPRAPTTSDLWRTVLSFSLLGRFGFFRFLGFRFGFLSPNLLCDLVRRDFLVVCLLFHILVFMRSFGVEKHRLFVSLARARFIRVGHPETPMLLHPWLRQQFPVLVRYPRPISVRASSRCPAFDQGPPPARD